MRSRTRLPPALPAAAALVALALIALAIVLVSGSEGGGAPASSGDSTSNTSVGGYDGAQLPDAPSAPGFTLKDQSGHAVSLSDYRGRVVMLTFLYSQCGATCFLVAQQIRGALDELSAERAPAPAALIVSADSRADTPANVARFLRETSLAGRVQYLTGSEAQLRPIWHAYGVKAQPEGTARFDEYVSVLLLDAQGRERVLFQSEDLTVEGIAHDAAKLDHD